MEDMCKACWNRGCRENEELRQSKVAVCKDMEEHPESWDFDPNPQPEYNWWDDRTY